MEKEEMFLSILQGPDKKKNAKNPAEILLPQLVLSFMQTLTRRAIIRPNK